MLSGRVVANLLFLGLCCLPCVLRAQSLVELAISVSLSPEGGAFVQTTSQGTVRLGGMRGLDDRVVIRTGDPTEARTGTLSAIGPVEFGSDLSGFDQAEFRARTEFVFATHTDAVEHALVFQRNESNLYAVTLTREDLRVDPSSLRINGVRDGTTVHAQEGVWPGAPSDFTATSIPKALILLGGALQSTFNCTADHVDGSSSTTTPSDCGSASDRSENARGPSGASGLAGADPGGLTFVLEWEFPTDVEFFAPDGTTWVELVDRVEVSFAEAPDVIRALTASLVDLDVLLGEPTPLIDVASARASVFDQNVAYLEGTAGAILVDPVDGAERLQLDPVEGSALGGFTYGLRDGRNAAHVLLSRQVGLPASTPRPWASAGSSWRCARAVNVETGGANPTTSLVDLTAIHVTGDGTQELVTAERNGIAWPDAVWELRADGEIVDTRISNAIPVKFVGPDLDADSKVEALPVSAAVFTFWCPQGTSADVGGQEMELDEVVVRIPLSGSPGFDQTGRITVDFEALIGGSLEILGIAPRILAPTRAFGIDAVPLVDSGHGSQVQLLDEAVYFVRGRHPFASQLASLGIRQEFTGREAVGTQVLPYARCDDLLAGEQTPFDFEKVVHSVDWEGIPGASNLHTRVEIGDALAGAPITVESTMPGTRTLELYVNGVRTQMVDLGDAPRVENQVLDWDFTNAWPKKFANTVRDNGQVVMSITFEPGPGTGGVHQRGVLIVAHQGVGEAPRATAMEIAMAGPAGFLAAPIHGSVLVGAPSAMPIALELLPASPNPFNPSTTLTFRLDRRREIVLGIHDVRGRLVNVLARGVFEAGLHELVWNGRDAQGGSVASGTYFARLASDGGVTTNKLVLLK